MEQKCKDRVRPALQARIQDIRELWNAYQSGQDDIHEYGLSFDYVAAGTFHEQDEGFYRWLLSWGGPSDEFRFYTDASGHLHRIEYWFMDWGDGAHVTLSGRNRELLAEWFELMNEIGSVEHALQQSRD